MILMVERDIRCGICHSIHWYTKANNKCLKGCDKRRDLSNLMYWDMNNINSEWVKNITQ